MCSYVLQCPGCHKDLKADESLLGQSVDCPACGVQITIPSREDLGPNPVQADYDPADSSTDLGQPPDDGDSCSRDSIDIEEASEAEIEKKKTKACNMSMKAFRESLRSHSKLGLKLASRDFCEKLQSEAYKIRRLLDT